MYKDQDKSLNNDIKRHKRKQKRDNLTLRKTIA